MGDTIRSETEMDEQDSGLRQTESTRSGEAQPPVSRAEPFNDTGYFSPALEEVFVVGEGFSVRARRRIASGELLVVFCGALYPTSALTDLPEQQVRRGLQVDDGCFLLPTFHHPADSINHSCHPNAGLSGADRLVSLREIAEGEGVVYDYAMSDGSPYDEFECRCGALECRGQVRGTDWQRLELQQRYRGYFSPYLQKRIQAMQSEASVPNKGIKGS
jgi:hypothetical protein